MAELSLVVKVTLVLIVALLATRLASRRSAAMRSLMLSAAFAILLLLPVATLVLPARAIEVADAYPAPFAPAGATAVAVFPAPPVAAEAAAVSASRWSTPSLRVTISLLWAVGAVVFVAPLVGSLVRLRRLRRNGQPWVHPSQPSSVDLLLHGEVNVPITFGAWRPAIVLPLDVTGWSDADLRRVLLHELEHVRRHDWAVHIAARVVCSLYWFHPLVWIAWRRLCLEAERACDDAVLREEDATAYAAQLVALARRMTTRDTVPLLSIAGRSNLSTRVGAMLVSNLARGPVRGAAAAALAGVAAMVVFGIGPLQAVTRTPRPSTEIAQGQSTGAVPRFDATSIRRTAQQTPSTGHCCEVRYSTGGQVSGDNVGLLDLIGSAYDAYSWWQILDAPKWADTDTWNDSNRFDIRTSAGRDASQDEMRQMLKTMLADRFRLAMHRETRVTKVYELVVEPTGHKLQPPVEGKYAFNKDVWLRVEPTTTLATLQADGITMAQLVRNLSGPLLTMVIDRTGLTGTYNVKAQWDANPYRAANAPADPARPTIFEAFPSQLGLRLRETTGPVEYLVIDRAERPTLGDAR